MYGRWNRFKKKREMVGVFLDIQNSILLLSKDTSFHVLHHILRQSDSERNVWYADKVNKDEIIRKLQISPNSLDKHIASLKARQLIIKDGPRGRYKLNMDIFSL